MEKENIKIENKRIENILSSLSKSKFRNSFHLKEKDFEYIRLKGIKTIEEHAHDLIKKRLAPKFIANDGRQTPTKGHPVFIAQHATATCCRECLNKWHKIPKGVDFTKEQEDYVVEVIMTWIKKEMSIIN